MFCKREIEMSDRASGNWYPYNPDGTQHDCRNEIQIGTKKVEAEKRTYRIDKPAETRTINYGGNRGQVKKSRRTNEKT